MDKIDGLSWLDLASSSSKLFEVTWAVSQEAMVPNYVNMVLYRVV